MRFAVVAHQATGTSAALATLRLEGVESAVKELPADLVVLTTHGRGELGSFWLRWRRTGGAV